MSTDRSAPADRHRKVEGKSWDLAIAVMVYECRSIGTVNREVLLRDALKCVAVK